MSDLPAEDSSGRSGRQLITLAEAAQISGLSHSHLRLLVRKGKIWGVKMGRDWLTTREAVVAYSSTKQESDPKRSHT